MNVATTDRGLCYQLDRSDRIQFVDDGWDAFALDNGAPELTENRALGCLVWDFVHGDETRRILTLVFDRVRESGNPVTLPFRCDSPDLRRFMTFEASPGADGKLVIRTELLRVESRDRPVTMLHPEAVRGEGLLRMCSWCNRFQVGDESWEEVEDVIRRFDLFSAAGLPSITHGICFRCADLLQSGS